MFRILIKMVGYKNRKVPVAHSVGSAFTGYRIFILRRFGEELDKLFLYLSRPG